MIPRYKYIRHHGRVVKALLGTAGKHRAHCLCFNDCQRFKPGSEDNCGAAESLFKICKKFNLVTPVYECPFYEGPNDIDIRKLKLCYVEAGRAFFTTQDVKEQCGDDWNDIPYEHNAGLPYTPTYHHLSNGTKEKISKDWYEDGEPKWKIYQVDFEANVLYPSSNRCNSPYSVDDINKRKRVPWIRTNDVEIMAGEDLELFISKITTIGGWVSQPLEVPPY